MKYSYLIGALCTGVIGLISTSSHAELIDRGGGLIYDSTQDLTWTKDAGLSGLVNWQEATDWAESLDFGGADDWRLPTTTQFGDSTCGMDLRGTETQDVNETRRGCLGGEMEQLTATAGSYDFFTATLGGTDGELFVNLYRKRYWTATPYRDGTDPCIYYPNYDVPCIKDGDTGDRTDFYWQWGFGNFNGINGPAYKTTMSWTTDRFAWAVRDGDIGLINGPVDLSGTVKTTGEEDICAMVLASGQFMFSCTPAGVFSLEGLPRENDGSVIRQLYADGFFPKVDVFRDSIDDAVVMTRSGTCPDYNTPYDPAFVPGSAGKLINITGKILLQDSQTPICAMVLANGQHMFSCDGSGSYALTIPLDFNGQFKLQVYADGFAPTIQTFDEFQTMDDVRMAPAAECQAP